MKLLYVLRHAKSSWGDPDLPDHDRPLAARGRKAAKAIAGHMQEQQIAPQLVLCSPALRARQTLERIEPALGDAAVQFEEELYGASAGELHARLRRVGDDVESVLVIGHNPGLQDLVLDLTAYGPERDLVAAKFPTAALATLASDGGWRELGSGTAKLVAFVRPRDLG